MGGGAHVVLGRHLAQPHLGARLSDPDDRLELAHLVRVGVRLRVRVRVRVGARVRVGVRARVRVGVEGLGLGSEGLGLGSEGLGSGSGWS